MKRYQTKGSKMLINWNDVDQCNDVISKINEIFRQDYFGNSCAWDDEDQESQESTIEKFFFDRIVFHQAKTSKSFRDINFNSKINVSIEQKIVDLFRNTFTLSLSDDEIKQRLLIMYRQAKDVCKLNQYHTFWKRLRRKDNDNLIEYNIRSTEMNNITDENLDTANLMKAMTDNDWEEFFAWYWHYENRDMQFSPSDWIKWKSIKDQNTFVL